MGDGPRRTRRAHPPGTDSGTFLALFGLIIAGLLLIGLSALVLPQMAGLLIVIVFFAIFVMLHYMLWGWLMSTMRVDDDGDEPQQDR